MPKQKPKQKVNKRIVLGVTGTFGSGKSTVAGIFGKMGASVIDADDLARKCIYPGSRLYKKIVSVFGAGILAKNRQIDRAKLAESVFNNRDLLHKLNSVIHPEVIRNIKKEIKASKSKIVILDAPLLIEAGLRNMVDKLIVVKISRDLQIKRIQKKLSIGKAQILKRIKCQMPQKEKVRLADFVIDNNGTLRETKRQVSQIRRMWWKN